MHAADLVHGDPAALYALLKMHGHIDFSGLHSAVRITMLSVALHSGHRGYLPTRAGTLSFVGVGTTAASAGGHVVWS